MKPSKQRPAIRMIFLLSLCVCLINGSVSANPTNLTPRAGLQAHGAINGVRRGVEDAKAAVKRLYELHDKHEDQAAKLDEQKADPGRIPHMQLANDFAVLWKALRDVKHLALMGEPAAHDLKIKLERLRTKIGRLAYHGVGPGQGKLKQQIISKLRKATPNRERTLLQQQQAISRGQLEPAEKALESLGMELERHIVFLSPKEAEPFIKDFRAVLAQGDSDLSAKQRAGFLDQARQLSGKNMEAVALFNSEATRIRDEIKAAGTAKIGDHQQATAADAIEYLTGLWGTASAGLLRNCALLWAFSPNTPSETAAKAIKPVQQLDKSARAAIVAIINEAATKVPPQQARGVYADILDKLSVIDRRMRSTQLSNECKPALKKLAAKDPTLPAQIAAYERATAEALRWRKSFASKQADSFRTGQRYTPTDVKALQKVKITESIQPKMYGPFAGAERPLLPKLFGQPAAWTISEVSPLLVSTTVSTDQTLRISLNSRTSVVPYSAHQYANVAVGMELQKELDALTAGLFVDAEHPALSMAAADALSSANLREFESVGGEVQKVHLEAVVTRFLALPDAAYMLAYLGTIPSIDDTAAPVTQICWRLDIIPHWVEHEYFTFAVSAAMKK